MIFTECGIMELQIRYRVDRLMNLKTGFRNPLLSKLATPSLAPGFVIFVISLQVCHLLSYCYTDVLKQFIN